MDLSATAVDEIDDIVFMVQTMTRLGVSHKGLKTLDEMKSAVKQKLTILPKKSSWTAREVRTISNART
ncbi:unnamed protein product [Pocillopora meandrina]|uniref:Uncharacterized protein n=1 Tax=Pocillopora meandrina TaxID=46732 RepID=A0AAU9WNA6_9CNID|nr:unnamed protein product [Pocillopora meandrina]